MANTLPSGSLARLRLPATVWSSLAAVLGTDGLRELRTQVYYLDAQAIDLADALSPVNPLRTAEDIRAALASDDREAVLAAMQKADPHGVYTDKACAEEGWPPCTLAEARVTLTDWLKDAEGEHHAS